MQKASLASIVCRLSLTCNPVSVASTSKIYCPSNYGDIFTRNLSMVYVPNSCVKPLGFELYIGMHTCVYKLKTSITYHGLLSYKVFGIKGYITLTVYKKSPVPTFTS